MQPRNQSRLVLMGVGSVLTLLFATVGHSGDWPQMLGPDRNGVAPGETLPAQLPAELKPQWSQAIGTGYAGPVVMGDKVLVFHRVDNKERLQAFDAATGKSLWSTDFVAHYRGGINSDTGPRCTPIVVGDAVVAFGAAADLYCVALADGKVRWSRELGADYEADDGYFGAGSTPIVIGKQILINLGGKDAGLIGISLADGKTLWAGTNEQASYSSPTYYWNGQTMAIFVTRYNAMLVDPTTGTAKVLTPFGMRGPTVNAATPLLVGKDHLFLTASYGIGAFYGRLENDKLAEVWANDDTLSSQYSTPVELNGVLYGIHGREDVGVAELRAVEAKTGRVLWSQEDFGVAHLLRAGERIVALKTTGELVLFAADPTKFRSLGSATIANDTVRAIPALAHGRFYFHTTGLRGGELQCLNLGEK